MVVKRWVQTIATHRDLVIVAGNHDILNTSLASAVDLYDGCEFVRIPTVLDLGGASLAAVVVGTSAPCVLTSRADSEDSKFYSIALGCRLAK